MSTPAGFYDDGSGRKRWWDGQQWTEQYEDTPGAPAATTAPPAASATSAPIGGAPQREAPASKPHVLGIVALIVAALGFVFACIPGALILGWILLPIGFILSLVALFMKGRKWPAVVGVILSVVGTIVGVVVFFAVVANAANDAFGDTDTSVTSPSDSTEDDEATDDEAADTEQEAAEAAVGTRENPAPIGSTIEGDDFTVVINSVDLDATDDVMAANPFNEDPPEGSSYAVVNMTVTYTGEDSAYAAYVVVNYVTAGGEVVDSTETLAVAPDPTIGLEELYNGASATGNTALAIPTGDAGALRVTPGLFADEVFVAIQ